MCTYLGASVLLEPEDLDLSMVEKAKVLYLEGYLYDHPAAKRAFITDILFANESEIISLYESSNFEMALEETKGSCEITAITLGEKGSIVLSSDEQLQINPYKLGSLIDTTGAGDLYAGGFLHGYTNRQNLYQCGQIGSICAGQIVTQIGPRSQVSLKKLLQDHLN